VAVDQRQQFISSVRIAVLSRFKNARDVAHAARVAENWGPTTANSLKACHFGLAPEEKHEGQHRSLSVSSCPHFRELFKRPGFITRSTSRCLTNLIPQKFQFQCQQKCQQRRFE